jgi:hypothetical protein
MHRFLTARIFVILIFLLVFYYGIAVLKTGETRSRGYEFNRDKTLSAIGSPLRLL